MTDKVIQIAEVRAEKEGDREKACRKVIDTVLEHSEDSPIHSAAIVIIRADGIAVSGYHSDGGIFTLIGATEMLRQRLYGERISKL